MDDNNYRIVNYQPEYKTEVLNLLAELWGQDTQLSNAYFAWKYLHNPYTDYPRIYLAFDNDQLVGVRSFCSTRWQVGCFGQPFLCLADADTVIHPHHRRQGLLTTMTLHALEDLQGSQYQYIVTLSANRYSSAAVIKMGWKNVGFVQTAHYWTTPEISRLERIARRIPQLGSVYLNLRRKQAHEKFMPAVEGSTFVAIDGNFTQNKFTMNPNIVISKHPQPEVMTILLERVVSGDHIRHVRDREFFSWRYQNPRSEYRFLYWGNNQIEGYLVLRARLGINDGKANIVEWEATDLEISDQLLKAAIQLGNFKEVSIWSETLSAKLKQLLTYHGFNFQEFNEEEPSNHFPPLVLIKPIQTNRLTSNWEIDGINMLDMHKWDLQAIYSDGY
jgi:hypothetical protein